MTNREAYVFGWVFGRINAEVFPDEIGPDPWDACMRPYTASAQIISSAHEKRLLTPILDAQIGEALSEITAIEPEMDGGSEKVQPLEVQGSWQLGYYAGKGKRPLSGVELDITATRKAKGMSQAQLAEAVGVNQPMVSRWESGTVSPNKKHLAKLKEVLA